MTHPTSVHSAQETVFDVDVEKLARVYAQAGLDAAGDADRQQSFVDDLMQIEMEVLRKNPGLERLFASALVSQDEKLGVIDRVFGNRVSDTVLNFIKVIGRHGRLDILRSIIHTVRKHWNIRRIQVAVKLELAQPIDPKLQQEMIDVIARKLNAKMVVDVEINPALIAGFVVRAGDRVFDASVRTNLERARSAMIDKAVEHIQQRPDRFIQSA